MINKYLFNFIIELALFVQIVLWICFGATVIIPVIIWFHNYEYFDIKDYLKEFRNYKIKGNE